MTDTVGLHRGVLPRTESLPAAGPRRRGGRLQREQVVGVAALAAICVAGIVLTTTDRSFRGDDGASVVPAIAMVAITVAVARWRPDPRTAPVRNVSARFATLAAIGGVADAAAIALGGYDARVFTGPVITLTLATAYLCVWGFRSLALLRTVMLLSLLTWGPLAELVHHMVRSSLEQPSSVVYRRLAQLDVFGVTDEPWRLFTAELHRGTLVVIATLLFGVAASRWRVSLGVVVELVLSISAALVAHHAIVLASSIDDYDPAGATRLATNPALEVAIAAAAVLALTWIRRRRQPPADTFAPTADAADDRDPVIFADVDWRVPAIVRVCLTIGALPLVALLTFT